jgi:5-(aminomethyl)-3-furanmethanol phosphate kinase
MYAPLLPAPALRVDTDFEKGSAVSGLIVVKVGGSLFDLPELGPRLRHWLAGLASSKALLVPGGGPLVDAIRDLDQRHGLGEEKSHWLALRALALNARVLAELLPESRVVESAVEENGALSILDPFAFCVADERDHPAQALPHSWAVTSDSVAARVAIAAKADQLILLKSITIGSGLDWDAAARAGYVDAIFPGLVRTAPASGIRVVNFRAEAG